MGDPKEKDVADKVLSNMSDVGNMSDTQMWEFLKDTLGEEAERLRSQQVQGQQMIHDYLASRNLLPKKQPYDGHQ